MECYKPWSPKVYIKISLPKFGSWTSHLKLLYFYERLYGIDFQLVIIRGRGTLTFKTGTTYALFVSVGMNLCTIYCSAVGSWGRFGISYYLFWMLWPCYHFFAEDHFRKFLYPCGDQVTVLRERLLSCATTWALWFWRNLCIFHLKCFSKDEVIQDILFHCWSWMKVCDPLFSFSFVQWASNPIACLREIVWMVWYRGC